MGNEKPPRFVLRIGIEEVQCDESYRPDDEIILFESWDAAEVEQRFADIENLPLHRGRDCRQTPPEYYDVFIYIEDEQFEDGESQVCAIDPRDVTLGSYLTLMDARTAMNCIIKQNGRIDNGKD